MDQGQAANNPLTTNPRALWAGTVAEFARLTNPHWLAAIQDAHQGRTGHPATSMQIKAWLDSRRVLARALRSCLKGHPEARSWGLAFEYELPWEGAGAPTWSSWRGVSSSSSSSRWPTGQRRRASTRWPPTRAT